MAAPITVTLPFKYDFGTPGTLFETGSQADSSSGYYWVNSGAKMILANGEGSTIHGDLPSSDPWFQAYKNDPSCDGGKHPQNIFRTYLRTKFQNYDQSLYFRLDKYNLSSAPERKASNGLCLMNRDDGSGNTLYHAILRVDGDLVVKRKLNGVYTTLQTVKIFPGTWNITSNPNLIPVGQWIGIKSGFSNEAGGVRIRVCLDVGKTGNWREHINFVDTATPITAAGYPGIRTDFSDVTFDQHYLDAFGTVPPLPTGPTAPTLPTGPTAPTLPTGPTAPVKTYEMGWNDRGTDFKAYIDRSNK